MFTGAIRVVLMTLIGLFIFKMGLLTTAQNGLRMVNTSLIQVTLMGVSSMELNHYRAILHLVLVTVLKPKIVAIIVIRLMRNIIIT
ncbi:MAG: hypothetical protein A2074_00895 [Candidatus Aquicultor primus]|uniref:Uncharacterized protein n=1 Tax=Candidatus Aquicultor primus TaxID=1797195 RepID=A0A1F2UZ54_9ACTN|nr:MAG: hypothetical protein A2074_00895 [Candidatus Aquicultor primus]